MKEKEISIKVVKDKEFKTSYWKFDVEQAIEKASRAFQNQFGVELKIRTREDWNPSLGAGVRQLPESYLKEVTKSNSLEKVVEGLIRSAEQEGMDPESFDKEKVMKKMEGYKAKATQFEYLRGYFDGILERVLIGKLKAGRAHEELVIGFTGKILFPDKRQIQGFAAEDKFRALITLSRFPEYAIIHEIGHLFGAEHAETETVMQCDLSKLVYDFNDRNRERIERNLSEWFEA